MDEPKEKFCRLCGKNKPADDFVIVPLARFENAMFMQAICKSCGVVVHNIREIVGQEIKKKQEQIDAQQKVIGDNGPKIIVPGLRVPRNIRS